MGMYTKGFIRMEFPTDSESIAGRTAQSTKAISFKGLGTGREYGAIPKVIIIRDNLKRIRKTELECFSGQTAISIKASSSMM